MLKAVMFGLTCLLYLGPAQTFAAEIKLLTTNGLRGVLSQVGSQFERESGHKLIVEYGPGPGLKQRIETGIPFDVAILPLNIDDLAAKGTIASGSIKVLGRTGYGAAVKKGSSKPDIATVESLRRTLLNARAVAFAAEGVSGIYFQTLLKRLGISEVMQSKTIAASAVAGSMSSLVSGEADIAIGGIAVILTAPGVDLVGWLPSDVQSYLVFTAGISGSTKDLKAATALINMLITPSAAQLFRSVGIEPVTP